MIKTQSEFNALMRRSKNRGANISALTGPVWNSLRPVIFGFRRHWVRIEVHDEYLPQPLTSLRRQPIAMALGR